jgi:predicted AAA+ superfamily ATPase
MSHGAEVDFIIDNGVDKIPIEVTYDSSIQSKKTNSLKLFFEKEPKAKFGIVIYNGEFHYDKKKRIYYLPAWAI